MALSGTVFIDRGNSKSALKAFEGAAEEMNTYRQSVFIFPEGTRSYAKRPELGPFKKGAFHLAVKAGVDVVPVVCANYWGVLAAGERRFRGGKIPVRGMLFLSTVPPFFWPSFWGQRTYSNSVQYSTRYLQRALRLQTSTT